jgi:hypothetical protein
MRQTDRQHRDGMILEADRELRSCRVLRCRKMHRNIVYSTSSTIAFLFFSCIIRSSGCRCDREALSPCRSASDYVRRRGAPRTIAATRHIGHPPSSSTTRSPTTQRHPHTLPFRLRADDHATEALLARRGGHARRSGCAKFPPCPLTMPIPVCRWNTSRSKDGASPVSLVNRQCACPRW